MLYSYVNTAVYLWVKQEYYIFWNRGSINIYFVVEYCSSVIIGENQLSLVHNDWISTKFEYKNEWTTSQEQLTIIEINLEQIVLSSKQKFTLGDSMYSFPNLMNKMICYVILTKNKKQKIKNKK